jgi:hypothetical protein
MAYEKISFTLDGVKYDNVEAYVSKEGDKKDYDISGKGCATMYRQYIKAKLPAFHGRGVSWIKSDYSSVNIYVNEAPEDAFLEFKKEVEFLFKEVVSRDGYHPSYSRKKATTPEGYDLSYGVQYVFVSNQPPYGANDPVPDWDKLLKKQPKTTGGKRGRKPKQAIPTPSPNQNIPPTTKKNNDKGELLLTENGWEFYKKEVNGKIVYNAYILPTTKRSDEFEKVRAEVYSETGFRWGTYLNVGSFSKWGQMENEAERISLLSNILGKYFKAEEPAPSKEVSKEQIEKAIKALQILADKGNEKATKAIKALKIMLKK